MKILDEVAFTMCTRLHYSQSNSLGMLHNVMSYHHMNIHFGEQSRQGLQVESKTSF